MRTLGLRIGSTDYRRWRIVREQYADGSSAIKAFAGALVIVGSLGAKRAPWPGSSRRYSEPSGRVEEGGAS